VGVSPLIAFLTGRGVGLVFRVRGSSLRGGSGLLWSVLAGDGRGVKLAHEVPSVTQDLF
jgi:hypothetical protein